MKRIVWLIAILTIGSSLSVAQIEKSQAPRERQAAAVCGQFRQNPGDYEKLFAPEFLAKIPAAQLTGIFTQYFSQLGRCATTRVSKLQSENAAEFEFRFEKGFRVSVNVSVIASAPNLIDSLWLGNPTSLASSLSDLTNELKTLPGETSILVARLSDDTAADQLLKLLGRERVESVLSETKHAKPQMNMPFLSTLEMFKLKGEPTHKAAEQYLSLDINGRRKFLAEQIADVKREDAKPYPDGKPAYIDRIEWFASASDLCRVMNWLRQKTEPGIPAAPLRDVLAINPGSGLNVSRERWSFIGFKGGSEPGVLNMTYLLRSTAGPWYAMSISWNDAQPPLDTGRVFALVQRALQIIE